MRVSILMDVPDDLARQALADDNVELELRNYRTGYLLRFRRGEFVLVAGDSAAEVVALRVVQLLKEWNGEKPLDTSELRVGVKL